MAPFDLPKAIDSCVKHGRQLYYRLVFLLGMDPSLSIEIIAFWLLVEGNGEVDFLQHINSFYGNMFLDIVDMGKQFIDAMHASPGGLKSKSASEFHEEVIFGICFFLNNVCYKVLSDLRQKAEQHMVVGYVEESPSSSHHVHHQYMKKYQPHMITSSHQHQGARSIHRDIISLQDMIKARDEILAINDMEESPSSSYHVHHQYMKNQPRISTSSHQYQGDSPVSKSAHRDIKSFQDLAKARDGILASHDMEEYPNSSYHVHDQYMKDQPHISNSSHQFEGDNSTSRSMHWAIECHQDMVKTRDGIKSMNSFLTDSGNIFPWQQRNTRLNMYSRPSPSPMPITNQSLQGMANRRYGAQSMNDFSTDLDTINPQQQRTIGVMPSGSSVHDLELLFGHCTISPQFRSESSTFPQSSTMNMNPCFHSRIQHDSLVPQDDRTLFVTFSNGHPLTKEEVYNFFMSTFGNVESVSIENPLEVRPPQYALVTFGSLETVLFILGGKEKVKFVAGGKHLWARRYVPRNHERGKSEAWI